MNTSNRSELFKSVWLLACFALLFIQYARPQSFVPGLELIRPFFLMTALLSVFIVVSGQNVFQMKHRQMVYAWATIFLWIVMVPFCKNQGIAFLTVRSVLMFFPLMLSILILVDTEKKLKNLISVFVLIGLFNTLHGLWQHDGGGRNSMFNLGNFLTDPNEFSLYMNMMIPFAYFMFMYEKKWNIMKYLYLGTAILMAFAVVISYSRGGLVGLMAVSFVIWLYSPNKKLTASLAVIGLLCIIIMSADTWKESMATTTDLSNSTIQTRLNAWIGSLKMIVDYPIFGVGPGNTPFYLNEYVTHHGTNHWYGSVNHSVWLTAIAEGGIIGFALFIALMKVNIKDCLDIRKTTKDGFLPFFASAMLGSLAGFFASGTFLTVNYYPHYWYLTAMIAAASKLAYLRSQNERSSS